MRFIQLSDLHLRTDRPLYGLDPWERLKSVLTAVKHNEAFDFVAITGDLVDCGADDPEAYRRLRLMLEDAELPFCITAGNHDLSLPEGFADPMPKRLDALKPGVYAGEALESDDAFCIFADTAQSHSGPGRMPDDAVKRIESFAACAAAEKKALLIFAHHPPFAAGYAPMDATLLENAKEVFKALDAGFRSPEENASAALKPFRPFAGYFCGHLHRPTSAFLGGPSSLSALSCWCAPSIAQPLAPYAREDSIAGTNEAPGYLRASVFPNHALCELVFVNPQAHTFPIPYIPFEKESESSSEGPLNAKPSTDF